MKVQVLERSNLGDIARRESRRFIAESGGNSGRGRARGRKGRDLTISVPPGTVVYDCHGKQVSHVTTM